MNPEEVRARFKDVGAGLVAPSARARDVAASFDRGLWRKLASAGLFDGATLEERAAAIEGFAEGSCDLGLGASVCAHLVVIAVLERFGSEEQKQRLLPRLKDGTWVGACANAEPGAGTDVMGLRSRATVSASGFTLSARKRSVTNVGVADVILVSARLQGVPAKEAVNIFVVDADGARVRARPRTDLSGLRTSPTGSLLAWRAPLPSQGERSALVGPRGAGLSLFRHMFSEERVTTGFLYLGALRACLARALAHAEQRKQFGQPIGKNQYVQDKIVRMRVAIELLEAQLWRTLERARRGEDVHASLSIVKIHGVDAAIAAAQDLVRLLGSRGISVNEPAEKLLRDLLALSILGGTVELQKIVVYNESARQLAAAARVPPARAAADIEVEVVARVDGNLERELVRLVAAAFPSEPSLKGCWYYDTAPDLVVVARRTPIAVDLAHQDITQDDGALAPPGDHALVVAARTLVMRTAALGERDVLLAGVGAAVRPGHDDAWALITARALAEAETRGADLALTFLLPGQHEDKLRDAGFDRLRARVTYLERSSGGLVEERMPCFVKELRGAALKDEIEARGALHLGVGTW